MEKCVKKEYETKGGTFQWYVIQNTMVSLMFFKSSLKVNQISAPNTFVPPPGRSSECS